MTNDLEKARKCAGALGLSPLIAIAVADSTGMGFQPPQYAYCPLHDPAQSSQLEWWLIERGRLLFVGQEMHFEPAGLSNFVHVFPASTPEEKMRAIVECVCKVASNDRLP